MSIPFDDTVEQEVQQLRSLPLADLRIRWITIFKSEPPKAFGPDLLRRGLAQKIQEDAYGGLPAATRKLLRQLMAQTANNGGKIVLPRRIKAGSILVKEWKGKTHRIAVAENGFTYEGNAYPSLSEIARLITGSRWNGPRFFGLRNDKDAAS